MLTEQLNSSSNSNVVAATILVAYHIFQDPALLDRVRLEIEETLDQNDLVGSFDPKKLHKMPLFYSVYAEVLRLYVDVLLIFSSPHEDVALGKWRLPRGEKALVSTSISHRDDGIWNTMGGLHPLDTFWGERFIVDPSNPLSGPIRPDVGLRPKLEGHTEPFFSTQGLESSWIPFGGEFITNCGPKGNPLTCPSFQSLQVARPFALVDSWRKQSSCLPVLFS